MTDSFLKTDLNSGFMAAYEGVPFPRHGAIKQVHAPEHGVRSEPAADLQHGTLDLPFFFEDIRDIRYGKRDFIA